MATEEKTSRGQLLVENGVKTLVILLVLVGIWLFWIDNSITAIKDQRHQGYILTVVGLLLAGSIAGTFAFSYKSTSLHNLPHRLLAHSTTLLLTLGIGVLFEITIASLKVIVGYINVPILIALIIVYASINLYDFWDLLRDEKT